MDQKRKLNQKGGRNKMKQVHWKLCETFDLEYESTAGSHAVMIMMVLVSTQ